MSGNSDFGRNNLDCLRVILASIVVLFHLSALTGLTAFSLLGRYCSPHFAVRSFFVISGLLIYRSYTRSSSLSSYFEKRVRRIYPAYFTVVAVAAVGLSLLSNLPLPHYFGMGFWKYLCANLVFLNFLAPSLPGVFAANPVPFVNGALWTLKIEVAFYLFVPILHWLCTRLGTRTATGAVFALSCLWRYGFAWLAYIHRPMGMYSADAPRTIYEQLEVQFPAQLGYFIAGVLLLIYFDKLRSHFAAIAGLTVCLFVLDHWLRGEYLDVLWISGVVLVFGFWRYMGNFARYGDFSYGLYIVHWPILQILIALGLARLSPQLFLLSALSIILAAAFLMWHLVEKRFLASSSHYRQSVAPPQPG